MQRTDEKQRNLTDKPTNKPRTLTHQTTAFSKMQFKIHPSCSSSKIIDNSGIVSQCHRSRERIDTEINKVQQRHGRAIRSIDVDKLSILGFFKMLGPGPGGGSNRPFFCAEGWLCVYDRTMQPQWCRSMSPRGRQR